MTQVSGKEIRIHRIPFIGPNANGASWEWTASLSIGHMAWTATGVADSKESAVEQAEAFIAEIRREGWK